MGRYTHRGWVISVTMEALHLGEPSHHYHSQSLHRPSAGFLASFGVRLRSGMTPLQLAMAGAVGLPPRSMTTPDS